MVVETGSLEDERARESPLSTPPVATPAGGSGTTSAAVSDTDTEGREETTDRRLKEYEAEIEPRRLDIPVTTSSPISPVGQSEKPPTPSVQDIGVVAEVPDQVTEVEVDSLVPAEKPEPSSSANGEKPPTPSIQDVGLVAQVPEVTAAKPEVQSLAVPETAGGDVGQASLNDEHDDRSPTPDAGDYAAAGSVLDDVLNDDDEGEPAGDEIPCVKCSDCAAAVPLTELPEHACPASTSPIPSPSAGGSVATFESKPDTTNLRAPPSPITAPDPLRSVPADVPMSPDDRGIASPVTPRASEATLIDTLSRDVPEDVSGGEETADKSSDYGSRCAGPPISSSATSF
jgi:hypothetical protein